MNNILEKLFADINEMKDDSLSQFGYKERMKIERTLFILLYKICKNHIDIEVQGFNKYYKERILEKTRENRFNSKFDLLITKIFEIKFNLQALSSQNAYVREETLSKVGTDKKQIFQMLYRQINSIKKLIDELDIKDHKGINETEILYENNLTNPLFLSIPIPNDIIEKISQFKEKLAYNDRIHWTNNNKLHITLIYLGKIDKKIYPYIIDKIENVISDIPSFTIYSERIELIENILAIKFSDNPEILRCYNELNSSLKKYIDYHREEQLIPHLTLAKVYSESLNINTSHKFENEKVEVEKIELLETTLKDNMVEYIPKRIFDLISE